MLLGSRVADGFFAYIAEGIVLRWWNSDGTERIRELPSLLLKWWWISHLVYGWTVLLRCAQWREM